MGLPIEGGFADVEEITYELLPKGDYKVVFYEGEVREAGDDAKHPGAEYINWQLRVAEGEEYENRVIFHMTSLFGTTEEQREEDPEDARKSLGRLKAFLKQIGYTDDELNAEDFEIEIEEIEGTEVMAEVYVQKAKKDSGYPDKNAIRRFWLPDEEGGDDLP